MANRPVRALVVDNYDSFTHNLVQCLAYIIGEAGPRGIYSGAIGY